MDVLTLFRQQPAATTLTRINLQGKVDIDRQPVEDVEYVFKKQALNIHLRRKAQGPWVPPSEDPFYKFKWGFYRSFLSEGE